MATVKIEHKTDAPAFRELLAKSELVQPVEPAPDGELLWIAFDFENDRVVGHAHDPAGAVCLANRHRNARVARVLF